MGKYYIGKGAQLLTEESEEKIRIRQLELLSPEFGHMPCIKGEFFTFILAEEGQMQCQINQERTDLQAGEALFINANQSYRLISSRNERCRFYVIEVSAGYLAAGLGSNLLPMEVRKEKDWETGSAYVRMLMEKIREAKEEAV